MKHLKIWKQLTLNSFRSLFLSRIGAVLFFAGKILRFIFFLSFLIILMGKTNALAGYTVWEVVLFYLTFNFIDAATQMFFREVYRFRSQIVSGNFDLILVKPMNVLLRALFGGADFLDLFTLFPFAIFIVFVTTKIPQIMGWQILVYFAFIGNSLLIAMAFHIIVLALAILTTEIDHAIMLYRDLSGMGKLPVDIYSEPLRSFMTFVIPVGIMMSFPVHVVLGKLTALNFFISFLVSGFLITTSICIWNLALRKYTSYSS